jgi:PhnB protein
MPQQRAPKRPPEDAYEVLALTPRICVSDALEAFEWYEKVFGARVIDRTDNPDGRVWHTVLAIGAARVIISDEFPETNTIAPTTVGASLGALHLYVRDVDGLARRAYDAGAQPAVRKEDEPFGLAEVDPSVPQDFWWGDRYVLIEDPFGIRWELAKARQTTEKRKENERQYFQAAQSQLTAQSAIQTADRWNQEHPRFNRPNVPPRNGGESPRFAWDTTRATPDTGGTPGFLWDTEES